MPRRELRLQKRVVRAIREAGGVARIAAQTGVTTVGDSDVYGCLRGVAIYWEIKDGEEYAVTKIQQHRMAQWRRAGACARTVKSLKEANRIIHAILSARSPLRFDEL